MLALLRSYLHFSDLVQRCAWALPVGSRSDCWRNELFYRAGDIENILVQNEHFFREDEVSQYRTCCPLPRNTVTSLFQSLKNSCESKTFMEPMNLSATVSMTSKTQICVQ